MDNIYLVGQGGGSKENKQSEILSQNLQVTEGSNEGSIENGSLISSKEERLACVPCRMRRVECPKIDGQINCIACQERGFYCSFTEKDQKAISRTPISHSVKFNADVNIVLRRGRRLQEGTTDSTDHLFAQQFTESEIENPEKLLNSLPKPNIASFPLAIPERESTNCHGIALKEVGSSQAEVRTGSLKVTDDTPIELVADYFRRTARLHDYTIELSNSATPNSFPIFRSVLGDIYRITISDKTRIAVKCVRCMSHEPDKSLKRSALELEAWRNLSHENIIQLRGFAIFRGRLAMISPWMANGNVIQYLDHHPGVDRHQICKQLASVVAYLHNEEVVHGDLKGSNILVSEDGVLKLTDFGLSIMRQSRLDFSETDLTGGTLRWQAPELMTATGQRSKEADVYALGMTMLEITTGKPPFDELDFSNVRNLVAIADHGLRPQRPEVLLGPYSPLGDQFWQLLESCWAHAPYQRPTAQQVHMKASVLSMQYKVLFTTSYLESC